MGKRADEIRKLTMDQGARRAAEILDLLEARLNACCPPGPSLAEPAATEAAPQALSETPRDS